MTGILVRPAALLLPVLLLAALPAAAADRKRGPVTPDPVGIGGGPNRLKRTPCACVRIDTKPGLPAYLTAPAAPPPSRQA